MGTFFLILIPAVVIMAIVFAAIGIKMFVKKDGQFERKCAHSLDPDARCTCGGKGDGSCKKNKTQTIDSDSDSDSDSDHSDNK